MLFSVVSSLGDLNCIISHHILRSSIGSLWSPKNGIPEGKENVEDQVDITIESIKLQIDPQNEMKTSQC